MLKGKLLHPQILHALARAGHGAKVLISDGNYPHWPKHGPNAEVVFLNLGPGKVLCGLLRQIDRSKQFANVEDEASLAKTLAALSS